MAPAALSDERVIRTKGEPVLPAKSKQTKSLLEKAKTALEADHREAACKHFEAAFKSDPGATEAANFLFARAIAAKKWARAEEILRAHIEAKPEAENAYFMLGGLLDDLDRHREAAALYRQALDINPEDERYYLFLAAGLGRLGRRDEAAQVVSLGEGINFKLRHLYRMEQANPAYQERSYRIDKLFREVLTKSHDASLDAFEKDNPGVKISRIREAVWPLTEYRGFRYVHPRQRPTVFYIPGLAPRPLFNLGTFVWVMKLEVAFAAIRDEVLANLDPERDGPPELAEGARAPAEGSELEDKMSRGSPHLVRNGVIDAAAIKRFPKTWAALQEVPLVRVDGVPGEVLLARLEGGTHIPAYNGLSNHRLSVHLPIRAIEGCRIRVANRTHAWRQGRVLVFDDSFEHEIWNDGEETQIVLIFEIWHPSLSEDERRAVEKLFSDREKWHEGRALPPLESFGGS